MKGRKISPKERARRQRQQRLRETVEQARRDGVPAVHRVRTEAAEALQSLGDLATEESLLLQLAEETRKFDALSDAYATLRREHITALVRLHRAHGVVSAAALRHKDEKLAALARDELRGLNKLDAEQKIPRAGEVLKGAEL